MPDVRDAQLAVARAALHRLSLIDEMAGMGQRDGDPELTARCHHAGGALETMDRLAAMPDGDPDGEPAPSEVPEKCRAAKHGRVDLHCTLPRDHEGWHEADYTDHQEVTYDGGRHSVHVTEHVTWEPADNALEATRMLLKDRVR